MLALPLSVPRLHRPNDRRVIRTQDRGGALNEGVQGFHYVVLQEVRI